MKLSRQWLSRHLDLQDLDTDALTEAFTRLGAEVESVQTRSVPEENLVVAQILSAEQHPNADRLKITTVDCGEEVPRQIVCGAKNYKIGDFVPCALPGCDLGGGFVIKVGELRGVESRGMLCAASEIGLEDTEDGLLILSGDPKPGTPVHELYPAETIFELEITPDRPDCLSHRGMARELAAFLKRPLLKTTLETTRSLEQTPNKDTALVSVSLEDELGCPFYSLVQIDQLENQASPAWMQSFLQGLGINPKSALVDMTNFVLHDLGQPLHAFDAQKIQGNLQVRAAKQGEKFVALDEEEYELTSADLVIADELGPVALAGVMGGLRSGVSADTCSILLESAYFNPARIRHTSRRLGLISDSSLRFERGVDPEAALEASKAAIALILEICSTKQTILQSEQVTGHIPSAPEPIELGVMEAENLLGTPQTEEEIAQILERIGLEQLEHGFASGGEMLSSWQPPSWRHADLKRPVDLIEEIARFQGIKSVPSRVLASCSLPSEADERALAFDTLRDELVSMGLFECRSLKLSTQQEDQLLTHVGCSTPLPLKNPLSADFAQLRSGLLPGLLRVVERNEAFHPARHAYFELGTVFIPKDAQAPQAQETREVQSLALLLCGAREQQYWGNTQPEMFTVHDLRGLIEVLLPSQTKLKLKVVEKEGLVLAANVQVGKKKLGWFGVLAPALQRELDVSTPVFVAELSLESLLALREGEMRYQEPEKFPATSRDLALEAEIDFPAQQVQGFFNGMNQPLIESVELFDLFHDPSGEKLSAQKKSLAWRVTYRHSERTLETEEVEKIHSKIREQIVAKLPVELR